MTVGPRHILLVEDNPADVRLMREALHGGPVAKVLHIAANGDEAEAFLSSEASPWPDLILLDLNLPGRHGCELLDWIRQHPRLGQVPVIIFSSSEADEDVRRAYASAANCYVTKPGDLDRFFAVLASIENFWLSTARLPGPAIPPEPSRCQHP